MGRQGDSRSLRLIISEVQKHFEKFELTDTKNFRLIQERSIRKDLAFIRVIHKILLELLCTTKRQLF